MTPAEYRKLIGRRIKAAREGKGWILRDLSAATGERLSVSRLGNYEAGIRTLPPWEAETLADALSVRASYLMCLEDGQLVISPDEEKLLRNWRALPENKRNDFARSIESQAVVYRDAVPDEKLIHLSAKGKKPEPARTKRRL